MAGLKVSTLYGVLGLVDQEFKTKLSAARGDLGTVGQKLAQIGKTRIDPSSIKALNKEIKELEGHAIKVRGELINTIPGSAKAAELKDQLRQLNSQLRNLRGAAKDAGSGMKELEARMQGLSNVGRGLMYGVTLPILAAGGAATKFAMDAVESENLFEVSMGRMTKDARAWSEDLRKQLGLNAFEVRQNVGTFNVMLNSMGLGEQKAYGMAKGLTQLAYDMASFYNLRPDEAFQKLQSGISGEIEPLKRLGIVVNAETVKQKALQMGLAATGAELSEQAKIQARYILIMEQTSKAQGDLARTMDSPTNQLRILKAQVIETAIQFGQLLIPVLQKVVVVGKGVVTWLNNLSPAGKGVILTISGILAAAGPLLLILSKLPAAIMGVTLATKGLTATVKALSAALTFLEAHPIMLVIVALAALGYAIYRVVKHFKAKQKAVEDEIKKNQELADSYDTLKEKIQNLQTEKDRHEALAEYGSQIVQVKFRMDEREKTIAQGEKSLKSEGWFKGTVMRLAKGEEWLVQLKAAQTKDQQILDKLEAARAQLRSAPLRPQIEAAQKADADAKAAEKIYRDIKRRHADEITQLKMERNDLLNEMDDSGNLKRGIKERKAIWADYADRIKAKQKELAKEEADRAKEAAEKKRQVMEAELAAQSQYTASILEMNGRRYDAQAWLAWDMLQKELRDLDILAKAGEDTYWRMQSAYAKYAQTVDGIRKEMAEKQKRIFQEEKYAYLEMLAVRDEIAGKPFEAERKRADSEKQQTLDALKALVDTGEATKDQIVNRKALAEARYDAKKKQITADQKKAEKDAAEAALNEVVQLQEKKKSAWDKSMDVFTDISVRMIRLFQGETAAKLAELDAQKKAEIDAINEVYNKHKYAIMKTLGDSEIAGEEMADNEASRKQTLAALDAKYALQRKEIWREEQNRKARESQSKIRFGDLNTLYREQMLSTLRLAFPTQDDRMEIIQMSQLDRLNNIDQRIAQLNDRISSLTGTMNRGLRPIPTGY